jgi:peptidoglycan hydrolase CwlO-like protein
VQHVPVGGAKFKLIATFFISRSALSIFIRCPLTPNSMLDSAALATIVPPMVTAYFAYLVARKKNALSERQGKAKLDADIQTQALHIVKGVMVDMKEEFRREIDSLRDENKILREDVEEARQQLTAVQSQLQVSDELIASLKSEIATLRVTIKLYEEEISRLRKDR